MSSLWCKKLDKHLSLYITAYVLSIKHSCPEIPDNQPDIDFDVAFWVLIYVAFARVHILTKIFIINPVCRIIDDII
jgi:hypothetical protein